MTSPLFFLQDKLNVVPVADDQVQVTVTLPADYLFQFTRLLDSLADFVGVLKRQDELSRSILNRQSQAVNTQAQHNLDQYRQRIVAAYDLYTAQGHNRNSAIKQISADLRADHHPWSSVDLVRPSLIEAGRAGRVGRPRGNS